MNVLKFRLTILLLALLPMALLPAQTLVFEETFGECNKTGGYDGDFSPGSSTKFADENADNRGWTIENGAVYVGSKCVRIANSTAASSFLSPAVGISGNVTLVFEAAAWEGKTSELGIVLTSGSGGGSLSLVGGVWKKYVMPLTEITESTQIRFSANKGNQCFLGNVRIYEGTDICVAPVITVNAESGSEFNGTTSFQLSTTTDDADIYYTIANEIDYSDNGNWTKYTGGDVLVKKSCTLKAVAVKEGFVTSELAEQAFKKFVFSTDVYEYKKVTKQEEIVDGGVYLIVSDAVSKAAGSFSSNALKAVDVTLNGGCCTFEGVANTDGKPHEFTITRSGDNYLLKTSDGKYLSGTSNSTNLSAEQKSDNNCLWNIDLEATNGAIIRFVEQSARGLLLSSGNTFKNYSLGNIGSSGYELVSLYRRVAKKGTINIKTEEGYGTFYSELPFVMPEGVTGGIITNTDGALSFEASYSAGATVPAETALLVKADHPGAYAFDYTMSAATAPEGNCLYGGNSLDEDGKTYVGENYKYYVLSRSKSTRELGFYWAAADGAAVKYQTGMAYLALSREVAQNNSVALVLDFDITGIETIDGVQPADNETAVYDLSGRKVVAPVKGGIYVKNGKKIIF